MIPREEEHHGGRVRVNKKNNDAKTSPGITAVIQTKDAQTSLLQELQAAAFVGGTERHAAIRWR